MKQIWKTCLRASAQPPCLVVSTENSNSSHNSGRLRLALPCLFLFLSLFCAEGLAAKSVNVARNAWLYAQTPDLHSACEAVDKHYNGLSSLETGFTESYRGSGMARSESGTMWLKKPGKMRWEYDNPTKKLFVTDGKTAWFYIPGERQARRAPVKSLDDLRSPLRYLLGHTKLDKEFTFLSFADNERLDHPADMALSGVPKGMADRISKVVLEITPDSQICRISIYSLDGSVTDFRFRGERDNVPLGNEQFQFHPPAGVEVLTETELAP